VQEHISSLPGVLSASASNHGFLDGHEGGGASELIKIEGRPPKPGQLSGGVAVTPRFFETAGIPLLAGRDFTERDIDMAPRVAIINETMAHFFFGAEDPIGKRFEMPGDAVAPIEIVGVAKDAKFGAPRDTGLTEYWPYRQIIGLMRTMCVEVRTAGNPAAVAARVRRELRDIDPNLPVLKIDTVEEQLNDVLAQERLVAALASFFGALAALLSCLGLYGVISYTVTRRTNEIGIRLALGATPARALRMVLRESLWLALAGIAIGVPAALAATRLISTMLFGVSATDPLTIAVATLLMLAVAAMAAFLPARRAARVDPMEALRHD
jgi:predicted permease